MKTKVKLFDYRLKKEFYGILSFIGLILSLILIFIEIDSCYKKIIGLSLLFILIITYFIRWYNANKKTEISLSINNSKVNVKIGNIFEVSDLKVISFNEYFDTIVDDIIIAKSSLNGQYIINNINNISDFDDIIKQQAKNKILSTIKRKNGKNIKYNLGSIIKNEDYLITAFSKFDSNDRAYLNIIDYISFLQNFWNELDIIYAGRSVSIPILGSGITRFNDNEMISDQELLELMLWSFKLSKIKFTYPSEISIIVHEPKKDKINFYKLKETENGI